MSNSMIETLMTRKSIRKYTDEARRPGGVKH